MVTKYETLPGRSGKNAKKALAKAVENGFTEEDVRTVREGYLIPVEVDEAEDEALSAQVATVDAWENQEQDRSETHDFNGEGLTRATESLTGSTTKLGGETQEPVEVVQAEEIVFPDPDKATHADIDGFAGEHNVTYEGIEAENAEKPTKAEKVAHIEKVIGERAAENDAKVAETGELSGTENKE